MSDLKTVDVVSSNAEPELALSVPADAEPSQARATSDLSAVEETVRRAMSERERLERLAVEIRQRTGREMATVATAIALEPLTPLMTRGVAFTSTFPVARAASCFFQSSTMRERPISSPGRDA